MPAPSITSMPIRLVAVLGFAALAIGQSISPTNTTLPDSMANSESVLKITTGSAASHTFPIAPLTSQVGLGLGATAISTINFQGNLVLVDPSNSANVSELDIAYISCDPNAATSNIDATSVAESAGAQSPAAIVLFSLTGASCNLTGVIYTSLFTMIASADSASLQQIIQSTSPTVTITGNGTASGGNPQTNNEGGPAPTTAVAMSILYSITGIITLLFLIIIATGAVRAHRHPERYGPRGGLPGRPRQSRAKGLARAMLETLPIVKFGDPEPVKPTSRDIELEDGSNTVHSTEHDVSVTAADNTTAPKAPPAVAAAVESGLGPAAQEQPPPNAEAPQEGELGCSICTEDFTTGEDVRVLPCNHKYHPACIDPWLLNVSGTCPLCRHDLRPEAAATDENDELPPPLVLAEETAEGSSEPTTEPQRQRRASRFLELHRLRHAPAHERIAALRSLREQTQLEADNVTDAPVAAAEDSSRRTRLTGRLRDTFRIKTRPQQPASE
ncbi:hypothetical protein BP5796_04607 [Coleophoma crateriformis]|uniref:RING-type domain-containing protein n=1 Tax=Coleophoma crateriformis TaxID=565419 RepID=A0A3D8S9U0_9HELO|nr:hypothetical protein BP5796_04607 [Coleophoma crateriformis]